MVGLVKLGISELWILRHDHSCKLPLSYSYCCFSLLLLLLLLSLDVLFFVFLCYVNIVIITACVVVVFSFVCCCLCSGLKINLGLSPVVFTGQRNFSSITTLFWPVKVLNPRNTMITSTRKEACLLETKRCRNVFLFWSRHVAILAGHCPLTSRYFGPWCLLLTL